MTLYHCTYRKLSAGDIIKPGNWGKKLKEIGELHPSWEREIELEKCRYDFYPNKPSRLNCTFCCDNEDTIKFYKERNCSDGFIYEVEFIDKNLPTHRGDFNAVEPLPRCNYNMQEIARLYWRHGFRTKVQGYENVVCDEILSTSPLIIITQLN